MTGSAFEGGSAHVSTPLFSIITSSFNQAEFLQATIDSVAVQQRSDVEHIVIDGGSTDGSVEILRANDAKLQYWVSKPDDGQPSAWNEGVRKSRGAILGFLNSDDLYVPRGLNAIAELALRSPDADWLIGGTRYFGEGSGDLLYEGKVQPSATDVLFFQSYAPQPGHFLKRTLIDRIGPIDESLQFSFDLDYFVRCALAGAQSAATPQIVAAFRFHGASKSVSQRAKHRAETDAVEARHWPTIRAREGRRAKSIRANYNGHLALEASRDALVAGSRRESWHLLTSAVLKYPEITLTRAFAGTVQRILGLRS